MNRLRPHRTPAGARSDVMGSQTVIPFRGRDSGPTNAYSVQVQKSDGAWKTFGTYADKATAHAVANRLREVGAPTRVIAA